MTRSFFRSPLVAVTACMLSLTPAGVAAQSAGDTITVTVANHNWLDMHVYLSQADGVLMPIGIVGSNETAELKMRRSLFSGTDVRLVADPIGGAGIYVSDPIAVGPDSFLELTLENAMPLSHLVIRPHRSES